MEQGLTLGLRGLGLQFLGSSFPDEDRLSKRKSIGETISLQVEVESRNSPEKEEVSVLSLSCGRFWKPDAAGPSSCAVH